MIKIANKLKYINDKEIMVDVTVFCSNGTTCIILRSLDGEYLCRASANIGDNKLAPDCTYIKNYAENEGVLQTLLEAEIVSKMGVKMSGLQAFHLVEIVHPDLVEKVKGMKDRNSVA